MKKRIPIVAAVYTCNHCGNQGITPSDIVHADCAGPDEHHAHHAATITRAIWSVIPSVMIAEIPE